MVLGKIILIEEEKSLCYTNFMPQKYIYIRDDDVYKIDKIFIDLFDFLLEHQIPIIYGVIPKLIDRKTANFLCSKKTNNPQLLDLVQHGWSHKNYSPDVTIKYEFGKSRSYLLQKEDITKGYRRMLMLFGDKFTPAFVPPYHEYNNFTLKAISKTPLNLFSAGEKTKIEKKAFLDFPARISLNNYDFNGTPHATSSAIMIRKVLSCLNESNLFEGLVFHHKAITTSEELKDMKKFFLFLRKLRDEKAVKIILFSTLIKKQLNVSI